MPHHTGRDFTEKEKEHIRKMENPAPFKQVESWKVHFVAETHDGRTDKWFVSVAPAGDSFRPWKVYDKKKPAIKFARKKAKENNGELLVNKKTGRRSDRQVYLD